MRGVSYSAPVTIITSTLPFEAASAGRASAIAEIRDAAVAAYRVRREDDADAITAEVARRATGSAPMLECLAAIVLQARLPHREIGKVLVSPADVDDAVQATAASVCRAVAAFRGDARFSTWVGTIARREAGVVVRRKGAATEEQPDEATASDAPRLSSMIVTQAVLDRALAEVGEPYRTALFLRDVEGYSYDEIAGRLGVPIGTVRSRISAARTQAIDRLRAAGVRPVDVSA